MRRNLIMIVAATALAAGCAPPLQSYISDQLVQAGIPPAMAQCMAGLWTERLDTAQLRRLGDAAAEAAQVRDGAGLAALLERSRALQDPEIVEVVTLSAARCAFNI